MLKANVEFTLFTPGAPFGGEAGSIQLSQHPDFSVGDGFTSRVPQGAGCLVAFPVGNQ